MIRVFVAMALPDRQEVIELELRAGSTVADALAAARLAARFPEIDLERAAVGIWSRTCARDARLRDGDRVEVYRALRADPKEARRARARKLKPSTRPRTGP
jgi:putative ubiquitin-RnfH superfamily antitoxin RatB of RatAB toxin-antitoxin module